MLLSNQAVKYGWDLGARSGTEIEMWESPAHRDRQGLGKQRPKREYKQRKGLEL